MPSIFISKQGNFVFINQERFNISGHVSYMWLINAFHVLFQMLFFTCIFPSTKYLPWKGALIAQSMLNFFLAQNTDIKWWSVAHRSCLAWPSVFLNVVPPSVSTFFSSNTDPKLTCARVLLLCFVSIHQISVIGSV